MTMTEKTAALQSENEALKTQNTSMNDTIEALRYQNIAMLEQQREMLAAMKGAGIACREVAIPRLPAQTSAQTANSDNDEKQPVETSQASEPAENTPKLTSRATDAPTQATQVAMRP